MTAHRPVLGIEPTTDRHAVRTYLAMAAVPVVALVIGLIIVVF